ncbi:aminoacyl--tRNA ligase-related protein [Gordonia sp. VNK1]|uniref:aminoacyl--tRNA ligase-related protein n=1 Tax=Gordonia oleivorans TaxID=3156618 RepID=UPI0032B53EBC
MALDRRPRNPAEFRAALIDASILIPTTQPGVYGFGEIFESVLSAITEQLDHAARNHSVKYERLTFPPVLPDIEYRRSDYLSSFPQLAGLISAMDSDEKSVTRALVSDTGSAEIAADHFGYADLALLPAACHPIYAMLADSTLGGSRRLEVTGRCFRHEPSPDPMRLQAFRMREYVVVGTSESVATHADLWRSAMPDIFDTLGLPVEVEPANDPFFGRTGKLLAAQQRELDQKVELVCALYADDSPRAIASVNRPGEHFGELFSIGTPEGVANTGCVAFGLERIVLAMLAIYGFDRTGIHLT